MTHPVSRPQRRRPMRRAGRREALLLTLTLFLATAPPAQGYGPFLTPATSVLRAGDDVVLNRTVSAPAGARVYLQHGQVVKRGALRHRTPYCYFFLYRDNAIIDTAFELAPDRFEVTALSSGVEYGSNGIPPVLHAAFPFTTQEASAENMITRIRLRSPNQPEVMSLKCGVFAVPNERNHLSLEEIREALGDVVTLTTGSE